MTDQIGAMRAQLAESNTRKLMARHGLSDWTFQWTRATRSAGVCRYRTRVIGISRPLAEVRSLRDTQNTALHEIAHALAGPGTGHGPAWKAVCLRIGAIPRATARFERAPQ